MIVLIIAIRFEHYGNMAMALWALDQSVVNGVD